jgi:CheY-like chemotaxis protein/GAF domain-containing protein
MKKWINNLEVKHKLRIVSGVSLLFLLLMGFLANYSYKSVTVLTSIYNAHRVHTEHVMNGISKFNNYVVTNDSTELQESYIYIDSADAIINVFGGIKEMYKTLDNKTINDTLFAVMAEIYNYKYDLAELMTARLETLIKARNKSLTNSVEIAIGANNITASIKNHFSEYNGNNFRDVTLAIDQDLADLRNKYDDFAASVDQIRISVSRTLQFAIFGIFIILAILVHTLSQIFSRRIVKGIGVILETIQLVKKGRLKKVDSLEGNDEVGKISSALNVLINSLDNLVDKVNRIENGDYNVEIQVDDEQDEVGVAFRSMANSLKEKSRFVLNQDKIKSAQNKLNEKIRGDLSLKELANTSISFLCRHFDANVGTFYTFNEDDKKYDLVGSFALDEELSFNRSFKIGEGQLGEVAENKKPVLLTNIPDNYLKITSSTGSASPANIAIHPLIYHDKVYGILEIASFKPIADVNMELLENVSEGLAVAINSTLNRKRTEDLLIKTKEQSEQLQTQQEELKVTNEELEEQANILKRNQDELQTQQEELSVTNEELEEKTQSLELQKNEIVEKNQELEAARKDLVRKANELEVTSKYKSEFLANMSHELRTPLNSLLILSRNLAENNNKNLDEEQVESAEIIYKSGNDLLTLINDILDLSKIESGKMTMNFEDVQIDNIIIDLRQKFMPQVKQKGIDFRIDIEKGCPQLIHSDTIRLLQIIKNLLSNAIKFTSKGGVDLKVYRPSADEDLSRSGLKPENTIAFSVKDSGIGISKEKQLLIFEAFQQADGSTSRKFGGTGLGLSISRELIKLLGGEIKVESTENVGSEFIVFVPIKMDVSQSDEKIIEAEEETKKSLEETKPETIEDNNIIEEVEIVDDDSENISKDDKVVLIIEDDVNFAKVLLKQCRQKSFKGVVATNGKVGLEKAIDLKPSAIILDIKLPGMDGMTILDKLKETPEARHIPVHIMSANEHSMDALKKGAIGYIQKPVKQEKLDDAFKNIEGFIDRKIKNLLIVEDDVNMQKTIAKLVGSSDVKIYKAGKGLDAIKEIKENKIDCMVLDLGLPDMTGFELLRVLEKEDLAIPPTIVYTGRELSKEENDKLQKYTSSVIIKGVKSEERLLDETALFLHRMVSAMPNKQKEIINHLYDPEFLFKNKSILIVDDDMRNIFALTHVFENKGMKVLKAENGQMALDVLNNEKEIDIVLMDIMMPVMDGYEAMEKIRNDDNLKNIPIIALTAKAMKEDRKKCIDAGANDYLSKPVDVDKLLTLMRVWLYQ